MKYQLVLQFPSSSDADYDRLLAIEEKIEDGIGSLGIVDGHDIGPSEMNIFIQTDDPRRTFEKSKTLLELEADLRDLKAGYRKLAATEYIAIYADGLNHFVVG